MKKLLLLLPVLLCTVFAQNNQIIDEALKSSPLETNLRTLTDQIGGRVPGTPAMQKAVQWGVDAFKAAGADSAKTEDFPIKASWGEGATEMNVVAPESFKVRAISIAWAPALAGHRHVPVIDAGEGTEADFAKAGNVAGAIVLVHSQEMKTWDDLFAEYVKALVVVNQAVKAKALAVAFQSSRPNDLLYRHTNSDEGEIDRLPMVLVAREDAARMARLLESGQKLYANLSIPNRIGGPIKSANVIAELRGTDNPDEFVILERTWIRGNWAREPSTMAAMPF